MAPFRIKRMTNAELVELAGEQGPLPMMDKFFAQPAVTKITRDDLDRKMSVHKYTLGDVLRDNEKAFKEIRRKEAALKEVQSMAEKLRTDIAASSVDVILMEDGATTAEYLHMALKEYSAKNGGIKSCVVLFQSSDNGVVDSLFTGKGLDLVVEVDMSYYGTKAAEVWHRQEFAIRVNMLLAFMREHDAVFVRGMGELLPDFKVDLHIDRLAFAMALQYSVKKHCTTPFRSIYVHNVDPVDVDLVDTIHKPVSPTFSTASFCHLYDNEDGLMFYGHDYDTVLKGPANNLAGYTHMTSRIANKDIMDIKGVFTEAGITSVPVTGTPWHREDFLGGACNFMYYGYFKLWSIMADFNERTVFADDPCFTTLYVKQLFYSEKLDEAQGISYICQGPGMLVITGPGKQYHRTTSGGTSFASAINWFPSTADILAGKEEIEYTKKHAPIPGDDGANKSVLQRIEAEELICRQLDI